MVIGNGLFAHAFSSFAHNTDVIIFASGVSNSCNTDISSFDREIDMLRKFISTKKCLVYFSTISVYDESIQHSPYVLHKQMIEDIISTYCERYIIFRIPIVVSKSDNPHTLMNNLVNQISVNRSVKIFKNSCRYIMDIDTIVETVSHIIHNSHKFNCVWNVCLENRIHIEELVAELELILNVVATKEYIDKGVCYTVPNKLFLDYIHNIGYVIPVDYNKKTLQKYYQN